MLFFSLWLVVKLERELNLPGIARLVGKPKRGGLQISPCLVQNGVGVVEKVEELCAKLQLGFFW